jgi:DNA-binding response OmpR family regulator
MTRHIEELVEHSVGHVVGRETELDLLGGLLDVDGPVVAFVHGIAGIGKTTLLRTFAQRARDAGARVVEIDGAGIEPSAGGFRAELAVSIGLPEGATGDEIDERMAGFGDPVVVAIDSYERLRLLDTWLRQDFVLHLPARCRVLIAGRDRPLLGWTTAFGRSAAFLDLALAGLAEADAFAMLGPTWVDDPNAHTIVRVTRGHPLALRLAAASPSAAGTTVRFSKAHLVHDLASAYVGDLPANTRTVVEAASVVRRTTRSLLRAMLPAIPPGDAFELLAHLPFVTRTDEGLAMHDLVHEVVQDSLRADDPAAYLEYRRAAWEQLTAEARSIGPSSLWRYTADMLALIDNPVVREAFFPASTEFRAVEPARAKDGDAIVAIAETTEPPSAAHALTSLWTERPDWFFVVRDAQGGTSGFYVLCRSDQASSAILDPHPIVRQWQAHLRRNPVAPNEIVLFMPRWLTRDVGEAACATQAACWLDVKRLYMELRPRLRRLYTTVIDLEGWAPVVLPLGFTPLAESAVELDGVTFHTAMLDFGPGSVDGWLATRVAGELGVTATVLDHENRTVRTAAGRVELTRLEFGVMVVLHSHPGAAVTRQQLLSSVWGTNYTEGSNVVDAVVRTLRRKLGDEGRRIEAVRGIGYRLET